MSNLPWASWSRGERVGAAVTCLVVGVALLALSSHLFGFVAGLDRSTGYEVQVGAAVDSSSVSNASTVAYTELTREEQQFFSGLVTNGSARAWSAGGPPDGWIGSQFRDVDYVQSGNVVYPVSYGVDSSVGTEQALTWSVAVILVTLTASLVGLVGVFCAYLPVHGVLLWWRGVR